MVIPKINPPQEKVNPLKFDKFRLTVENLSDKKVPKKVIEANSIVFFVGRVIDPLKEKPGVEANGGVVGENIITNVLLRMIPGFLQKYIKAQMQENKLQQHVVQNSKIIN